jgi:hypothetical protein
MAAIVKDTTTYRQLPDDPTKKHKATLGSFLLHKIKNKDFVSDPLYHRIQPALNLAARLFAHPKLHKDPYTLRPIVAGQTSIFAGIDKELTCIIQPTLGRTPYHLRDSKDLKSKLEGMIIPSTRWSPLRLQTCTRKYLGKKP